MPQEDTPMESTLETKKLEKEIEKLQSDIDRNQREVSKEKKEGSRFYMTWALSLLGTFGTLLAILIAFSNANNQNKGILQELQLQAKQNSLARSTLDSEQVLKNLQLTRQGMLLFLENERLNQSRDRLMADSMHLNRRLYIIRDSLMSVQKTQEALIGSIAQLTKDKNILQTNLAFSKYRSILENMRKAPFFPVEQALALVGGIRDDSENSNQLKDSLVNIALQNADLAPLSYAILLQGTTNAMYFKLFLETFQNYKDTLRQSGITANQLYYALNSFYWSKEQKYRLCTKIRGMLYSGEPTIANFRVSLMSSLSSFAGDSLFLLHRYDTDIYFDLLEANRQLLMSPETTTDLKVAASVNIMRLSPQYYLALKQSAIVNYQIEYDGKFLKVPLTLSENPEFQKNYNQILIFSSWAPQQFMAPNTLRYYNKLTKTHGWENSDIASIKSDIFSDQVVYNLTKNWLEPGFVYLRTHPEELYYCIDNASLSSMSTTSFPIPNR